MSLDLYLHARKVCPHCASFFGLGDELWWRNITHNVTEMWGKAGVYDAFYMSEGHQAMEYVSVLERGLTLMVEDFKEYKALDAPNGWGRAEHAVAFLWAAYVAFRNNPEAMIRVSK